jgi:hypothetical protein
MTRIVSVGLLAALWGGMVSAHHSTAMFSWGMEKTLKGTISKWEWTQPHSFIWVDVSGGDGKLQKFGLEGMSPSWLGRRGWNNKTLAVGDKVTITYYPVRDGRPGGFFVRIVLPSGKILDALPRAPGGGTPPSPQPASTSQAK